MSRQILTTDVAIIGAGIAGLWLHHRLNQMGYHALLLENAQIGHAQTLSAQGIIHGGSKYALNGVLSKSAEAISNMPARWKACLEGDGEIDLSAVRVLTPHQLLWSTRSLSSKMVSFFASKALQSRMQPVAKADRPAIFQHPDFKGALYQLDEPVLHVPDVLQQLAQAYAERIVKTPDLPIRWQRNGDEVDALQYGDALEIRAQAYVLTAGGGNGELLESLAIRKPQMQLRPLQMLLCKSIDPGEPLPQIFAHSLGSGSKPVATITSHPDSQDNVVWYIGGNIAEEGVDKTPDALIQEARALLQKILPWVELPELEWATHPVSRAEPRQQAFKRPDSAFVESTGNLHIAWPTKLALAPDLADKAISALQQQGLQAGQHHNPDNLERPVIAATLWNRAFQS